MSQEKRYFKIGEAVFYHGLCHHIKSINSTITNQIMYSLEPIGNHRCGPIEQIWHGDEDLLSETEYFWKNQEELEKQKRRHDAEQMYDLLRQCKFIPLEEKDRLWITIRANELGTRNPYLDIFNANNISPEFERHLSGLRKDLYKSLGLDKMLKDDLYQGGVHLAKPVKNGFIVKAKWPEMDEFESPYMKALRKYVEEDLKAAKETAEMAAEEKKNKMSITVNEEERIVTVVFEDGSVRMSRCSKDDHFDPVIGVAMCIAARKLGSRTKLKKYVESNARFVKSKKEKGGYKR